VESLHAGISGKARLLSQGMSVCMCVCHGKTLLTTARNGKQVLWNLCMQASARRYLIFTKYASTQASRSIYKAVQVLTLMVASMLAHCYVMTNDSREDRDAGSGYGSMICLTTTGVWCSQVHTIIPPDTVMHEHDEPPPSPAE
jgi:hypothetical protein